MIASVYGNYRVERELGEGGMSHVYVGRTITEGEGLPAGFPVVLKIMSDELAGDVTARKRFVKEAQILSRLRHRYITRFYEFINDDRGAVLVMEFVEGTPVDNVLSQRGALPVREAIGICQCLLEALVYAHGKGIVHRDIKPANLIQEPSGIVKVTDFGIGKIKEGGGAGQTVLTRSGFLLGTPHYMSPEQIREPQNAGPKSDVYSTAVLLYEMLTGTLPFNSRSLPKLIDAIYRGEKDPPRKVKFDIPRDVEAIVLKGMEPRAENRYDSAREMFEALEEYNARQPLAPHVVMPSDETGSRAAQQSRPQVKAQQWALVSIKGDAGEKHAITGDDVMVGRDRSCAIVLTHPAVSRRHARITISGSDAVIEDLKSANGTYVNNARVERVALKAGDVVRFGADPACSYVLKDH